jgi:hypothetical protein
MPVPQPFSSLHPRGKHQMLHLQMSCLTPPGIRLVLYSHTFKQGMHVSIKVLPDLRVFKECLNQQLELCHGSISISLHVISFFSLWTLFHSGLCLVSGVEAKLLKWTCSSSGTRPKEETSVVVYCLLRSVSTPYSLFLLLSSIQYGAAKSWSRPPI